MIGKIAIFCKNLLDWFKSDRCFIYYFIKAFSLANNLMVLTILMLSIFIITIYMIISAQLGITTLISLIVIILLSSAFAAGFFYLIKTITNFSVENKTFEKNDIKKTFELFYTGIGKHYLSFVGIFILFFILASIVIIGTVLFVDKFLFPLSSLGDSLPNFFAILAYPSQTDSLLQSLDDNQKMLLRTWSRSFLLSTQTFTFLIMLWIPEVMYSGKNVLISLFGSVKKLFSDFPNAICLYLTIMLLNYIIAILTVLGGGHTVVLFLLNILSLYILIYNFYAIFLYYRAKFEIENNE